MSSVRRILVPVDLSRFSRAAVDYAVELSVPFKAAVEVLYVSEPNGFAGGEGLPLLAPSRARKWDDTRVEMRRELEAFLGPQRDHVLTVHVEAGNPGDKIAEIAREGEFDLIVMGSHGRSGISRLLLGSVAESVMRKSPVPVLTLNLPARAPREGVPL